MGEGQRPEAVAATDEEPHPEITLRDLLERFSYDCMWRTQSRTKKGRTDCGVYLPDLEQRRLPDMPPGMVKLRLVKNT